MQIHWPTGESADTITPEQRKSITEYAKRNNLLEPITIHPMFAGGGGVMLYSFGMWFGVEKDGYMHT